MKWILIVIVVAVGMLQPVQAGMNAEFRRHAAHPLQAGMLNMVVGAVAVIAVALALRIALPSFDAIIRAPWWALCGGLIGGTIVLTMLIAAPRLGAALLIACFVVGQLVSSTTIDHFGWIGYPVHTVSWSRIVGILLLIAGVIFVERSTLAA